MPSIWLLFSQLRKKKKLRLGYEQDGRTVQKCGDCLSMNNNSGPGGADIPLDDIKIIDANQLKSHLLSGACEEWTAIDGLDDRCFTVVYGLESTVVLIAKIAAGPALG